MSPGGSYPQSERIAKAAEIIRAALEDGGDTSINALGNYPLTVEVHCSTITGMAPGNKKNTQNYDSSDSQYSLMEFMREFPDDEACLQWLWRNRYSPNGQTAYCPKCETQRVFRRYETKQQRQSWCCVACGHFLHPTSSVVLRYVPYD
jgi:Zn ribbon nucleic-acid-binding protein